MGQVTAIEWTDRSSNPVRYRDAAGKDVWACVKCSPGCANCYSEAMARRFGKGGPFTKDAGRGLSVYYSEAEAKKLLSPRRTPDGSKVFVGDMTDVFGPWVPDAILDRLFAAFALRPGVTFQVLTKRADRLRAFLTRPYLPGAVIDRLVTDHPDRTLFATADDIRSHFRWPLPNVWVGASVESQEYADRRIPDLLATPAAVRFLSCEPLLGHLDLTHRLGTLLPSEHDEPHNWAADGIRWVICGGESGPGARPMHPAWPRSLRDQCVAAGVPFFMKQWGGWSPEYDFDAREHTQLHADGRRKGGLMADNSPGWVVMNRVGKRSAGRLLDGREWSEFPAPAAS